MDLRLAVIRFLAAQDAVADMGVSGGDLDTPLGREIEADRERLRHEHRAALAALRAAIAAPAATETTRTPVPAR